jgi:hypothetical protein
MSRTLLLFAVAVSAIGTMAHARILDPWPYDRLMKEADLVVIATPVQNKGSTDTFQVENWKGKFHRIETVFEPGALLKGKLEAKTLTLLHYRFEADPEIHNVLDGPMLVHFHIAQPGRLMKMKDGVKDHADYLLFLKKRADGRYEAVSGQIDPALAVRELDLPRGQ